MVDHKPGGLVYVCIFSILEGGQNLISYKINKRQGGNGEINSVGI